MFGMFFLGALYLQRVLRYNAFQTGLAFLPTTLAMGTLSVRYTERLVTRFGARTMQFPGLAAISAGLVLFAQAPVHGGYAVHVLPPMLLLGIGAGLCFPALMTLAMSGATPGDAGLASGLVNTSAQIGGALGLALAVLATLSTTHSAHLVKTGTPVPQALTSGYHFAFWIAAGLLVAAIGVAAMVVQPTGSVTQDPTSEVEPGRISPAIAESA
ncbi:MAG: MFS transporter [Solirubrobacteraceae bacterium]